MLYFKTILESRLKELYELLVVAETPAQRHSLEKLVDINKKWLGTVNAHISVGNLHIEAIGVEV